MTTPFRAPGRRGRGRRRRSRWRAARRSAPAFALHENSVSGLGNAYAGGAAVAEDAITMWWNPAGLSRFPTHRRPQRRSTSSPRRQVQQRRLAAGAQPAAGQRRRRRRRLNFVPNMYIVGADQSAVGVRLGINVPFGLDDRVRRRLDRPLPGAQVEDQDDQRQPGAVVEGQRRSSRSASASTTSRSRPRSPATSTIRRRSRRRAAGRGRHCPGSADVQRASSRRRPGSIRGRRSTATTGRGAGTSASRGTSTPQLRVGAHYRSEIKYNVRGNVNFSNPTCAAPGTASRARADDRCARRRRQSQRCTAAASPPTSSCRRSPTCRSSTGSIRSGT